MKSVLCRLEGSPKLMSWRSMRDHFYYKATSDIIFSRKCELQTSFECCCLTTNIVLLRRQKDFKFQGSIKITVVVFKITAR